MATILITGGAGFIGSHTTEALLARGHRVRILDILDPQIHGETGEFPTYLSPEVEKMRGDVCDPVILQQALDGVDAVYHFAAQTGVGQSMYDLRSYIHTNCTGTAALLEVLIKSGVRLSRLVLASSRAVYGEGTHRCPTHGLVYPDVRRREEMASGDFNVHCPLCGVPADAVATAENRPLMPISVYGLTKKQQEEYCGYAAAVFDLPVISLRYFNVYGSRQALGNPYTGVVTVFYNRILSGRPISLYEGGTPLRDFVHVSDVVRANLLALEADIPPGTCLNVGSGEAQSISQIAQALSMALGRDAHLEDRGEYRVGDIHAGIADLAQARRLLDYRPMVTLEAGMAEFVAWAREQETVDRYEQTVEELARHGLFGQAKR